MKTPRNPPRIHAPSLTNIRRRIVPLTATAATLSLTGCGMLGLGGGAHDTAPANTATLTPDSTAEQVLAFTAGMDDAIAKVDRDKFRAAAQRQLDPDPTSATPSENLDDAATNGSAHAAPPPALPAYFFPPDYPGAASPAGYSADGPMLTLMSFTQFDEKPPVHKSAPRVEDPSAALGAAALPSLDAALEALHARVAAHPTLNTALALALLENAEGKTPDPATIPVSQTLSPDDQKILQDLTSALERMTASAPGATLADRAAPLLEASKKWQADADLNLPKLLLASRVDSYGVYNKLDPKFPAGKKQTVIIYCEVANFSAKKTDDGWYETRLSQQETLATDDGLLLWRPNAEDVEDRSKNQRHDFYLVKKLIIPDNLAVGKYALRMNVIDKNTNKGAVITLPIEITN